MNEYLTIEEMEYVSERINGQEGQNYPCSNQVVTCGFFASRKEWEEFCNENKHRIKQTIRDCVIFEDGERWHWFSINSYNCSGYRFYKIKVSCTVDRHIFIQNIYPYCIHYCKEFEWIRSNK